MSRFMKTCLLGSSCFAASLFGPARLDAAKVTLADALRLIPLQEGIDYDKPTAEQAEKCSIDASQGIAGWVVTSDGGQVLRRFLDTNKDDSVDQWCYFKNGIEIYRDVDSNFNGKADQYRWMGTAGTRWGQDDDEDGQIETWKMISPEEVTEEVVEAIRKKDSARFKRVLLTTKELKSLGLAGEQAKEIEDRITVALTEFNDLKARQKSIASNSEWIHFGGSRPGIIPAGANGNAKDIVVYDNVSAVVATGPKHSQVTVGTLIKIDDGWRTIDVPRGLVEGDQAKLAGGLFFQAAAPAANNLVRTVGNVPEATQKLVDELQAIEMKLQKGPDPAVYTELADTLWKLAEAATDVNERTPWVHQFADRISGAIQDGTFPDGIERLNTAYQSLDKEPATKNLAGYILYRKISAEFNRDIQAKDADPVKVQEKWLKELSEFVKGYPAAADKMEAMLQLAIAAEWAGNDTEAISWFKQIATEFPETVTAKKVQGAIRRLESVGKSLAFTGMTVDGKKFDLATLKGRPVVIHYWDTKCKPCKDDMKLLRDIQAKLGNRSPTFIGVNLDDDPRVLAEYLKANRIPWGQLYEKGALEGRYAIELGIFTLPTMLLIDPQGRVDNRSITAGELESALAKFNAPSPKVGNTKVGNTKVNKK